MIVPRWRSAALLLAVVALGVPAGIALAQDDTVAVSPEADAAIDALIANGGAEAAEDGLVTPEEAAQYLSEDQVMDLRSAHVALTPDEANAALDAAQHDAEAHDE